MSRRVSVHDLCIGAKLAHPIFDEHNHKLLDPHVPLTNQLIDRLEKRGVEYVVVHERDVRRAQSEAVEDGPTTTVGSIKEETRPWISCPICEHEMPLLRAERGEPTMTWFCKTCNASFPSVLDESAPDELRQRVKPAAFAIERDKLIHPSERIYEVVTHITERGHRGKERRASQRMGVTITLPALPVDEHFQPLGEPFCMVTRNISTGGICLIHDKQLFTKYLVLELPTADRHRLQLIAHIVRSRQLGNLVEYGAEFVMRIDDETGKPIK